MASLLGGSAEHSGAVSKGLADMEDEDDLFEINLDAVDSIPPPQYYWDNYFSSTGNALLANCLLPVTDISRAVPMVSKQGAAKVVRMPMSEPVSLGQLLGLPFLEAFGLHQKELRARSNLVREKEAHLDAGSKPLEGRYYIVNTVLGG